MRIKKRYKFGVKDWLQNEEERIGIFFYQIFALSLNIFFSFFAGSNFS